MNETTAQRLSGTSTVVRVSTWTDEPRGYITDVHREGDQLWVRVSGYGTKPNRGTWVEAQDVHEI